MLLTVPKGVSQGFNADNQRNAAGYAFDGNGNPTTYAGTALAYDPESRLKAIGNNWAAAYRADGLRAYKENLSSETRTYFLYDGGLPVVELDTSGNVVATNVYGPDGLVASHRGGVWTYYTFDQQGNVSQRLNASESVLSSSIYDAYGVESSVGSPTDPFGYNGQWGYYLDRETGLYSAMWRYYDPGQGRWLNRDPIGYTGGINLYGYCSSAPVGWADPEGLQTVSALPLLDPMATVTISVTQGGLGHAWIEVRWNGRVRAVIENNMMGNTTVGDETQNPKHRASVSRTLPFDKRKFRHPQDIISDLPSEYNLVTNNCVETVLRIWKRLTGEDLRSSWHGSPTPGLLEQEIKRKNREKPGLFVARSTGTRP